MIKEAPLGCNVYFSPGRLHESLNLSTRQYAPIVHEWISEIGLDSTQYGTLSMRRPKVLPYRRTKSIRAVQLQLGHTRLKNTVRYLSIEVDDALEMSEQQKFN